MRYLGSKSSTVERVYKLVANRMPSGLICDPFGGIGIVGAYFKQKGYCVWSGDILTAAHFFQIARIERNRTPAFKRLRQYLGLNSLDEIIKTLNCTKGEKGWFVKEYSERREFFTMPNAKRINACRLKINKWWKNGLLSRSEHAVLLASLINCLDRVANTAGTYYAYMKTWYRKAIRPFNFELLRPVSGHPRCRAFLTEAKDLVNRTQYDILYLDPPYNQRSYAKYYHLPETIARGEAPRVHGMSGIPHVVRPNSDFNRHAQASQALEELIANARFRILVFHYSDDGLINRKEIQKILSMRGKPNEFLLNSTGYSTRQGTRNTNHRLFIVENG